MASKTFGFDGQLPLSDLTTEIPLGYNLAFFSPTGSPTFTLSGGPEERIDRAVAELQNIFPDANIRQIGG